MKIIDQNKNTILNCVKSYDELAADELDQLRFAVGESKDDFDTYQVRRNGKGVVIGVAPYDFSESKEKAIDEGTKRAQDWFDMLQVQYGQGKAKSEAVARLRAKGIDTDILTPMPAADNLLDSYLSDFSVTRYEVAKQSGIAASTLQRAAEKNSAFGLNTKVVGAVAYTIGTDPGRVLNDLVMLEVQRDL